MAAMTAAPMAAPWAGGKVAAWVDQRADAKAVSLADERVGRRVEPRGA